MGMLSRLLDLVYPRVCGSCGGMVGGESGHVCWECLRRVLLISDPFCALCGDPGEGHELMSYKCHNCRHSRIWFDSARSAAHYAGALKAIVRHLKYDKACHLASDLGLMTAACVRSHYYGAHFDAVAYVPLHCLRERERGYNQAALLAANTSRMIGVPVLGGCLVKTTPTPSQTSLDSRQRRANVAGVFSVSNGEWIEGKSLLLVDDIMTTGATLNECAKTLKEAGAAEVRCVTAARG